MGFMSLRKTQVQRETIPMVTTNKQTAILLAKKELTQAHLIHRSQRGATKGLSFESWDEGDSSEDDEDGGLKDGVSKGVSHAGVSSEPIIITSSSSQLVSSKYEYY